MTSMNAPTGNQDGGEKGEAATAVLISDVLGGDLVYQHTPGEAPQGIDLSYLHDGELHVAEVKSIIGDWHQSSTSPTVGGRQMDSVWVADRLERTGIDIDPIDVGTAEDQVHTDLFQVDFHGDTIARYDINMDGQRAESSPTEIYSLSEVLGVHEESDFPEPDAAELACEPDAGEANMGEGSN
ncbi:hypothetical protein U2G91_21305 [Rhodococcoides fascians]|uniref:hypothetical protein n=1 Tax=Rhodococcoides fascians TaxID=1828 RepID=UPI002ACE994F|nr:hypothetical protein [Rhodococcus fascians]WQH27575.1 hypothetical protein U2G91_21305 [Rhodococcus fascians]